ncbi:unnamed protein product [Paramecium primaurelia]|uniref:Uncharacterized protein n=1 Tax=Paramecium primaurelia TaxID=5886 RepID=A0A8S1Q696_PARPR|nr:unnamed protein product [Paramecium primaurelia]
MTQQSNLKLKCQQDDYKDEIDTVCYNYFKGIKKVRIHQDHFDNVEKINSLIDFIQSKNNECDNLINDLNTFVENMNQLFSQLTIGIKGKLIHLNSLQLNDYFNSTIKLIEYKQSITAIISEQTKKLTHSFNNLYEQLSLSYFNYYEIHDKSKKLSNELYDKRLYQSLSYDLKGNLIIMFIIRLINTIKSQQPFIFVVQMCMFDHILLINQNIKQLNKKEDVITGQSKYQRLILSIFFHQMTKDAITRSDKALVIDPNDAFSLMKKVHVQNY